MKFFFKTSAILLCFLLIISNDVYAQKKSRKMVKADQAFSAEQYNKAAELYKKVYQKVRDCPRREPALSQLALVFQLTFQ